MILNKSIIIKYLQKSLCLEQLPEIKKIIDKIKQNIRNSKGDKSGFVNIAANGVAITVKSEYINNELNGDMVSYIDEFLTEKSSNTVNDLTDLYNKVYNKAPTSGINSVFS